MLADGPRVAAVDVGTRRVGVAVSDGLRLTARPVGTLAPAEAVATLRRLAAAPGLATVVVGWPLREDGTEGAAVARVRPFFNRVRNALPGVEVVPFDERFTSAAAQERLYAAGAWGRVRRGEKGLIDAEAACVLLEDWLRETRDG